MVCVVALVSSGEFARASMSGRLPLAFPDRRTHCNFLCFMHTLLAAQQSVADKDEWDSLVEATAGKVSPAATMPPLLACFNTSS